MKQARLTFGRGNAKLGKEVATFSLPAGHTCPGAMECLAKVPRNGGKLQDGPSARFRCFAASAESVWPSVRKSRWANLDALREAGTVEGMATLIARSLPKAVFIRIHVSGDFYSDAYFQAWCVVARAHPDVRFYAYTKSLVVWGKHAAEVPANMTLTASRGGKYDEMIDARGLKSAEVVYSPAEAAEKGLEIDHDDSHAMTGSESFALLIHGTQRAGSSAAKALSANRAEGWTGYSR